jgi:ABC-type cobalamin/Fe3+-siderophores transport system ATPase subunit
MSDLHLKSLEIKNFRCFEHLVIEKLGRVNLIVGKNSVGKTCLLEALLVYATGGNFSVIQKLLTDRGELNLKFAKDNPIIFGKTIPWGSQFSTPIIMHQLTKSLRHVFYNHKLIANKTEASIQLNHTNVAIKLLAGTVASADPNRNLDSLNIESLSLLEDIIQNDIHFAWQNTKKGSDVYNHEPISPSIALFPEDQLNIVIKNKLRESNTVFVPQKGISRQELQSLWSNISLRPAEDQVIHTMQSVSGAIERMNFIGEAESDGSEKYPMAKIKEFVEPIPLGQLGEGVSRAMGIALALTNTKNGFLLIDEFETGLHHTVQTDIWRMIFETAKSLNIHVFATTHSWDCVEAFQKAAAEDQNGEAMLIRLQRKKDGTGIHAVSYDERRMAIATEQGIEVR